MHRFWNTLESSSSSDIIEELPKNQSSNLKQWIMVNDQSVLIHSMYKIGTLLGGLIVIAATCCIA